MLVKLNEKNKHGKDLYQNAITGEVSTLGMAKFQPSERRTRRHVNDKPRQNNRASHGEQFVQTISIIIDNSRNKVIAKNILHYTQSALERKNALAKAMHGI